MEKSMEEVVDDGWGRHRADDEVRKFEKNDIILVLLCLFNVQ